MNSATIRYCLGADPAEFQALDSPRRYRKDVIRSGKFFVPHANVWLDVDQSRMDRWVAAFGRMKSAGVPVKFTVDHRREAEAVRGEVVNLFRAGDVLKFDVEVQDTAAETAILRNRDVSLELEPNVVDGRGNQYAEAVTAISLVSDAVVPGQSPFQRIAASRENDDSTLLLLGAIKEQDSIIRRSSMTPDHLKRMQTAMDLKPETTEEDTLSEAVKRLEKAKEDATHAKETGGDNRDQELADAKKEADDTKKELGRAREQILLLSKSGIPSVDPDALEAFAEARQAEIDGLVRDGKITPAVAKKLCASLIGEAGHRPALTLSTKAATAAGLSSPLAKAVLEALKDNDPVLLGKLVGEKSGLQHSVALGRPVDAPAHDPKVTEEMKNMAYPGKK